MTATATIAARRGTDRGGQRNASAGSGRSGIGYVLPTWSVMLAMGVIPIGYALWMSVSDQSLTGTGRFIGLDNFAATVFTADFLRTLGVTLLFVVLGLIVQFVFGYILALCLHQQLRGFKFARTILLIPMMLTPVVVGLIWQFMFNPELGVMPFLLQFLGIDANWLADPILSPALIVLIDSWIYVPFVMLMVVAALSGIPEEAVEAAEIDGAGWAAKTRYIILPLIAPVMLVALLVRFIDIARLFDIIYVTTGGGPGRATENATMLVFSNTFQFYEFGYGAAMAIALTVLMFPVYFVYLRLTKI